MNVQEAGTSVGRDTALAYKGCGVLQKEMHPSVH